MASSSKKSGKSKQPARELDTSNATKGVWLIKVPNYLSDMWKEAEPNSDLGLMRITKYEIILNVDHASTCSLPPDTPLEMSVFACT